MANIKSAKKRISITKRNRERNVAKRSKLKTLIKKIDTLTNEKELNQYLSNLFSQLDKETGAIIHKNKANRLKSNAVKRARSILAKESASDK